MQFFLNHRLFFESLNYADRPLGYYEAHAIKVVEGVWMNLIT